MANGFGDWSSVPPRSLAEPAALPRGGLLLHLQVLSFPRRSDIAALVSTLCHWNPIGLVGAALNALARIRTVIEHDDSALSVPVEPANGFRLFTFGIDWPIEVRRSLSATAMARPPAKKGKRTRRFANRAGEHQNLVAVEMREIAHSQSLEVEEAMSRPGRCAVAVVESTSLRGMVL